MHNDQPSAPSAEDLAALRDAVLRWHDQFKRSFKCPISDRTERRLERLHLGLVALGWHLAGALGKMLAILANGLLLRRARPGSAAEADAIRLFCRLSGTAPPIAREEIGHIGRQLLGLDLQLPTAGRPAARRSITRDELAAVAAALIGYYLAGQRTDDELIAEAEAAATTSCSARSKPPGATTRTSRSGRASIRRGGERAPAARGGQTAWNSGLRPIATVPRCGAGWTGRPSGAPAPRPAWATADVRGQGRAGA